MQPTFDLDLQLWSVGASLSGVLCFNKALYESSMVYLMAQQLERFSIEVTDNPTRTLDELCIMHTKERQLVQEQWNATAAPFLKALSVKGLFEAAAGKCTCNVGLIFQGEVLTFGELEAQTANLSSRLLAVLPADSVVGLCVSKSVQEVAGMVGIIRAGAAYVPLDSKLPVTRLAFLIEQCECSVAVVQRRYCHRMETEVSVRGEQLMLFEAEAALVRTTSDRLDTSSMVAHRPGSTAYVLFTSGTTGQPKGLIVQHESLITFLTHESGPYGSLADEHIWIRLYVLAFTFDDSVGVVWRTLASGAVLCVAKPDAWLDPAYIMQLLTDHNVTSIWWVPSPFGIVLDTNAGELPMWLVDLHLSGEVLPPALVAQVLRNKHVSLYNPYGPAEVTINSHAHCCELQDAARSSVPIGQPMPNTVGIVVGRLGSVPIGVAGELWLGGPKVSQGYIRRPDLTQKGFPCPITAAQGRFYSTGDRVRWLPDGKLEFLGRIDFQVCIG